MKCPNCGFEVEDDAKFCEDCGSPIDSTAAASASTYAGGSDWGKDKTDLLRQLKSLGESIGNIIGGIFGKIVMAIGFIIMVGPYILIGLVALLFLRGCLGCN